MSKKNIDAEKILALLSRYHVGAENAIQSKQLELRFGLKGASVRSAVNYLRTNGEPIGSNADGYFFAESAEEVDQTIHQLLGRIKSVIRATDGLVTSQKQFRTEA